MAGIRLQKGHPGELAERMIARYEAELADAHPVTDAEIAHFCIVEQLVDDWRRRLEATTHTEELHQ